MSQALAKTPPAYNSSVLCPCDPIPLLVVLFSIAGTGHYAVQSLRKGILILSIGKRCWKISWWVMRILLQCGKLPSALAIRSRYLSAAYQKCAEQFQNAIRHFTGVDEMKQYG